MTMSEKLAALSDPEVSVHYSSLPDAEILRLWDTTRIKDAQRYFLYREILGRGLESRLLSSQKKKHRFLWDNEYLIIEHQEEGWGCGGFATFKSLMLYFAFIFLQMSVAGNLDDYAKFSGVPRYGLFNDNNSWMAITVFWLRTWTGILLFLSFCNSVTNSYVFVTNQRIGYYRTICRIFKLPPKWLGLNEGHLISHTFRYWQSPVWAMLGIHTKEQALKHVQLGLRLDRYDLVHRRINFTLNLMTSIYLFELIQLITSKTKAVVYNEPIVYPQNNEKNLFLNYRFRGFQLEDLQHFFKTIDWSGILKAKNKTYGGKTNMERLASFFKAIEAIDLGSKSGVPSPDNPETVLAYLPGSLRGLWKSPLICLTTTGVKYYKWRWGWENKRMKFSYPWSDPNLTVEISTDTLDIMYKKKRRISMYWEGMDVPIVDIFHILDLKKIYPRTY